MLWVMAHRYRLYPDPAQQAILVHHCWDARTLWNAVLEQANCWRPGRRPSPGNAERQRQLTQARAAIPWLAAGSSSVQQQALRDFDQALRHWWAGTHRRPTWRRRGQHEGFCIRDVTVHGLNGTWATVVVPKAGRVRFRLSRRLPAAVGMARVTQDRADRWHVSVSAAQPRVVRVATGGAVGLDLGVIATVTSSAGAQWHTPGLRLTEAQRLRRLQRRWARQATGSRRRERTRLVIARLRAREADRRRDAVEWLSTRLVRQYDVIAIEDLPVRNMLASAAGTVDQPGHGVAAKRGLNRAIAAQGWALFRRRLQQKAATCGVTVVAVPPAYTSQRCARCGDTRPANRESQAVFRCRACGHAAHADVNAADNIRAAGQAVLARGGISPRAPREARTDPVAA